MRATNLQVGKVINVTERINAEYPEVKISASTTTGEENKVTSCNGELYNSEKESIGNFNWFSGNISLNLSKAQSFDVVSVIESFISDVEESKTK